MAQRQRIRPQLAEGLTQAQSEPLDTLLYAQLSEVLTRGQMSQWNLIRDAVVEKE